MRSRASSLPGARRCQARAGARIERAACGSPAKAPPPQVLAGQRVDVLRRAGESSSEADDDSKGSDRGGGDGDEEEDMESSEEEEDAPALTTAPAPKKAAKKLKEIKRFHWIKEAFYCQADCAVISWVRCPLVRARGSATLTHVPPTLLLASRRSTRAPPLTTWTCSRTGRWKRKFFRKPTRLA